MLSTYELRTQQLLQNPAAPISLYQTTDIDSWINQARGQLAGESESIRIMGTLPIVAGTQVYPFTAIDLGGAAGVQGVIKANAAWLTLGSGQRWMHPRGFPWFSLYQLNNPAPVQGQPRSWCQYGQGIGGTIYVADVPDTAYTINCDCVCYPEDLVDDTTPEAIPYFWTDAVPYFAAYLALLSAQSLARQADAKTMFDRYTEFVNRARRFATPATLPGIYPQQPDLTQTNQLGLGKPGGGP